jgi:hypothetical protein
MAYSARVAPKLCPPITIAPLSCAVRLSTAPRTERTICSCSSSTVASEGQCSGRSRTAPAKSVPTSGAGRYGAGSEPRSWCHAWTHSNTGPGPEHSAVGGQTVSRAVPCPVGISSVRVGWSRSGSGRSRSGDSTDRGTGLRRGTSDVRRSRVARPPTSSSPADHSNLSMSRPAFSASSTYSTTGPSADTASPRTSKREVSTSTAPVSGTSIDTATPASSTSLSRPGSNETNAGPRAS